MTFDKNLLLKTFAPKVVPIKVEFDGKTVDLFARELSARQVFELQAAQKKDGADAESFTSSLIAQTLCDENGKPVMTEAETRSLAEMQVKAYNKLAEAVAIAVGLGKVEAEGAATKPPNA
jgi:hypothetical protein